MKTWIAAAAGLALTAGAGAQVQSGMDMAVGGSPLARGDYPLCSMQVEDSCRQVINPVTEPMLARAVEQHARAGQDPLSAYQGMGGPIEEDIYPPCDRGPGDDNCIQLYESAP